MDRNNEWQSVIDKIRAVYDKPVYENRWAVKRDAVDTAKLISRAVNRFGVPVKEWVGQLFEVDNKGVFVQIAYAFVEKQAECYRKGCGWYDGRNEYSCKVSSKIASLDGWNAFARYDSGLECSDWAQAVAEAMISEHRTLQQTFASVCFYYISSVGMSNVLDSDSLLWISTGAKNEFGFEDWYKMPCV